jgi:GMP synthase-like glutamine amidotransferase
MRLLVVEHERDAPAGLLAAWADLRGHELEVVDARLLDGARVHRPHDAVVSLGSEQSVAGELEPWLERELELLRTAHQRRVPVLGICFGGQALARALGGTVAPAGALTVDWRRCETLQPELVPAGPWLRWHEDVFTLPPGAQLLARAGGVPLAFALDRSVGLQFHPEADGEIVEGWVAGSLRGLEGRSFDEPAIRRAIAANSPRASALAHDLFDRIAGFWGWV